MSPVVAPFGRARIVRPLVALQVPAIVAVNPNFGTEDGGTEIVISGRGFAADATVTVGGASATSVSVNAAGTEITCTTPAGTAGERDVVVSPAPSKSAPSLTLAGGFEYTAGGGLPADMEFHSSFDAATGTGSTPNVDGGKWDTYIGAATRMEVIANPGNLGFPAGMTNIRKLNIDATSGSSRTTNGSGKITGLPNDGDKIFYRWFYRVNSGIEPWPSADYKNHNIENGNTQNWTFQSWVPNDDGTWEMKFSIGSGDPMYDLPASLDKDHTYRFELMLERVSSTTFNADARVYDESGTLLYTGTDFTLRFGTGDMVSNSPHTFTDVTLMDILQAGCNGFGGTLTGKIGETYAWDGGYAVRTADWCGPWTSAEEA